MHLDVCKNFEEKVSYVARRINGMVVDDQINFLSVDCGLPSDTRSLMCSLEKELHLLKSKRSKNASFSFIVLLKSAIDKATWEAISRLSE